MHLNKLILAEIRQRDQRKLIISEYPVKYDPDIALVKLEEAAGGLVANLYERVEERLEIVQVPNDEPVLYRFFRNKELVRAGTEPFVQFGIEGARDGLWSAEVEFRGRTIGGQPVFFEYK